ncbi:MAG: NADH-quinone oxidoreductase subunit C [Candidatus Tectomicrobia bacterium]|uniref:NADH-quinone oxidoreductase subunit C n=1 Tax=Tectimicrobiota bacterium TaxID=2528274 RepID=A0A932GN69_UNCTE|nr:NADH-quinone oxidoreductase subunit C [Candidatus Tectomicrobia bacterium]
MPVVRRLRQSFPEAVREVTVPGKIPDELTVLISAEKIVEVCRFLKEDPELSFDYLADLTGVHYPDREECLEVVYHLYSMKRRERLRLKVRVREEEAVESVSSVWRTANWHEREAYDLVGVRFRNHPDLRRILLPEEWEGHPLRKEYPVEGKGEGLRYVAHVLRDPERAFREFEEHQASKKSQEVPQEEGE